MPKAGVHPKVVSERLGHASISITLDAYSHVLPGLQEGAAEKFERTIETDTNPNPNPVAPVRGGFVNEPGGIRTRDALIKRYKRMPTDGQQQ